jgi:hypothetical protein
MARPEYDTTICSQYNWNCEQAQLRSNSITSMDNLMELMQDEKVSIPFKLG